MTIREKQKEQRKWEIIYTAMDLFVLKGYSGTKVNDIASAANMSVGLLFHYFESKERLYEELIKMGLEGSKMPFQIDAANPMEFFSSFLSQLLAYTKEQPWVSKMFVLMSQAQRDQSIPPHIRELALRVDAITQSVEVIKAGQNLGMIRDGDPLALSSAFWSSVQGIMEQLAVNEKMPIPEAEWIVAILRK